ncbi:class I SAM-dependent methyltransferase [Frankia sp. AgB32]|uniref:class I SAM-dependent methyltransferase n=1 Tax=Frankia sp. AgB32 TaxID=631119 RepID=UPI00200E8F1D|nr:class I SAM-dependent methyltransferase [Frankia sp. AgB32]MCK9893968.1 class I SAM-dependent methyltransferase [Frankia sp. AgB32]
MGAGGFSGAGRRGGRGHRPMGGAGGASRTAVLVCQGRAVAHGRLAPGRFDDPTALALLRPDERAVVEEVRVGVLPTGVGPRLTFEMVRSCGDVMAPRTITIDDALRDALRPTPPGAGPVPQVVILGAGLDGRIWRMPELAGTPVFEVDHPASQRDKRERAEVLPAAATASSLTLLSSPTYVPVDFSRDDLDAALAAAGHRRAAPTVWIWEGVVPYLTRGQVLGTLGVVGRRSAPGSRLVVHYHPPTAGFALGRLAAGILGRLSGRENPMAREPNRSAWTPRAMRRAVGAHGFTVVRDDTMLTLARRFATPARHRQSLRGSRVLVADHG